MQGALYRKYRPRRFEDVIDQRHITRTIENSIAKGSFAHAYLLTGPRGVGKTTVARLFAYGVNGLDYDEEQNYSDIIEIDAASNRRIDEIRELREKINIAPSLLKYKVYIIDEVHMLTREAFNALLKTLEEPPQHAIFILATTDFHKVPDTIVSRCVRFSFSAISSDSTKKHLAYIAEKEKIDVEDGALEIIAANADGSFRDAISLLDQFRNSNKTIKADYVARVLGLSPDESIKRLLDAISGGSPKSVLDGLAEIREGGSNDPVLIKQLLAHIRSCLTGKYSVGLSQEQLIRLSGDLLKAVGHVDVSLALEIALLEAAIGSEGNTTAADTSAPSEINEKEQARPVEEPTEDETPSIKHDGDLWTTALAGLKDGNTTLYSIARMAEVKYNDKHLELHFKFPFHFKQMNMEKNKLQITKLVQDIDPNVEKVEVYLSQPSDAVPSETDNSLKDISNIFGSAEVIES